MKKSWLILVALFVVMGVMAPMLTVSASPPNGEQVVQRVAAEYAKDKKRNRASKGAKLLAVIRYDEKTPDGVEVPQSEWASLPQGEVVRDKNATGVDFGENLSTGEREVHVNGKKVFEGSGEGEPAANHVEGGAHNHGEDVIAEGQTFGTRWAYGARINVRDYVGANTYGYGAYHDQWAYNQIVAWANHARQQMNNPMYRYVYSPTLCENLGGPYNSNLKDGVFVSGDMILCNSNSQASQWLDGREGWGGWKNSNDGSRIVYGYAMVGSWYPSVQPNGLWAHEIGHAFGLYHNNCPYISIMETNISAGLSAPQPFDAESLSWTGPDQGCSFWI